MFSAGSGCGAGSGSGGSGGGDPATVTSTTSIIGVSGATGPVGTMMHSRSRASSSDCEAIRRYRWIGSGSSSRPSRSDRRQRLAGGAGSSGARLTPCHSSCARAPTWVKTPRRSSSTSQRCVRVEFDAERQDATFSVTLAAPRG